MALTPDSLIDPQGRLNPAALWPKDIEVHSRGYDPVEVSTRLRSYIVEGLANAVEAGLVIEANQETTAKAWAYHRSWDGVAQRLIAMPSTVDAEGEGSSSYLLTQIQMAQDEAQKYLDEYEASLEVEAEEEETVIVQRASQNVATGYVW